MNNSKQRVLDEAMRSICEKLFEMVDLFSMVQGLSSVHVCVCIWVCVCACACVCVSGFFPELSCSTGFGEIITIRININ